MIYFVKSDDKVKIGYTDSPQKRIQSIQTSSPHELDVLLLIEGSYDKEKELHKKFKIHACKGEWFSMCDDIINFIEENSFDDRRYEFGFINEEFKDNQQIKRIRNENNLTLQEVAEKLKISPQTVGEFEKREADKTITLNSIDKLADVLGYKLEYRMVKKTNKEIKIINSKGESHKYVISNDEAKDGDRVIVDGRIFEFKDKNRTGSPSIEYWTDKNTCKKIIATTDENLTEYCKGVYRIGEGCRLSSCNYPDCRIKLIK